MTTQKLVAIVCIDTFSKKFEPFSPECLLPVPVSCNQTLLDLTIEFLLYNKVEDIFLVSAHHEARIQSYIEKSQYHGVRLLFDNKWRSVGDALREIHTKGYIKSSSFILLASPGIISNLDLTSNLDRHCAASKKNRDIVMTVLCSPKLAYFPVAPNFCEIECDVNGRIVNYTPPPTSKKPCLGDNRFNKSEIYLCDAQVLSLFTHSVLADHEYCGYLIHTHTLDPLSGGQISLISDLNSYYTEILRLVQANLTLEELFKRTPIDPNESILYEFERLFKKWMAQRADRDSASVVRNVFTDSASIGKGCQIENCFIAAHCAIGDNVKLCNSIVLQSSLIGPNSVIDGCIIGSSVRIGANVHMVDNCVIGHNVHIKNGTVLSVRGTYIASHHIDLEPRHVNMDIEKDNYRLKKDNFILKSNFKIDN